MAGGAERLKIGPVETPTRRLPDRDDVIDQRCWQAAAGAGWVGGEVVPPRSFPIGVVAARLAARPTGIVGGLPRLGPRRDQCALLTAEVRFAAMAADTGGAGRHHATGAKCGRPLMNTAPAAIEVPPVLVITART